MGQRSTTHVANQYHEDIFIKVDGDRQYVTLRSVNVSGVEIEGSVESTTEYGWQYANKNGYTRIAPGDFLGFNPDSSRNVVYITILTQSGRIVCHCYPLTEDFSVIVNKEGYVKETEHGHILVEKH